MVTVYDVLAASVTLGFSVAFFATASYVTTAAMLVVVPALRRYIVVVFTLRTASLNVAVTFVRRETPVAAFAGVLAETCGGVPSPKMSGVALVWAAVKFAVGAFR